MAQTRYERESDQQLIDKGWKLLGRFPDCIIWEDKSGMKYTISAKQTFLKPKD